MIATGWQRVEGGLVFAAVVALIAAFGPGLPWWGMLLIFLAPDLSFAAYLFGPRAGAAVYNAAHLYGTGAALSGLGLLTDARVIAVTGAFWVAHAGFDRLLGYGLKAPEGFSVTHLGRIGRSAQPPGG